jgi:glutamate-1-semialdehyde aminotransferase
VIGGGLPVGAFRGKGRIMDHLAPTARCTRPARFPATRSPCVPA